MLNIDLNLLNVFLKIYESESLSKAAQLLKLTQPGVSLALKRLRDHFEDPLFVRTAKRMEPTVFAHAVYPYIQKSADSLQEALSFRLNFQPENSSRIFKVSMSDFGQLIFLPPLLKRLSAVAPLLRLDVMPITQDVERRLSEGDIDLVLGFTLAIKDHFYQQLLTET